LIYRPPEELPEELDEELAPPDDDDDDDDEDPYPPELEELMPGWVLFAPGLAPGAIGALGALGAPGADGAAVPPRAPPPPADCAVANGIVPAAPISRIDPISADAFKLEARMVCPLRE
jgi:hypothetical protein